MTHRFLTTPLVIATMAFAVVAFLFLIDTAINPDGTNQSTNQQINQNTNSVACTLDAKICPDGSAVGRTGPNCEFTECPTTTNTNSETNQSTNTNTTATEVLPTNVKRFTSSNLGITFTYLTTAKDYKATVQEIGDKVYINTNVSTTNPITNGQWVQVFSKDSSDTLTQAITKRFLSGISTKDCFVTVQSRTNISKTQSAAIIDWPAALIDDTHPFGDNSKCPKEYQKTNGERYLLTDSQDPTKLLFFSIGQYAIQGWNDNYETTWQQTLRITEANPTAGWKTYTNSTYRYSFKYPPPWVIRDEVTTTEEVILGCGIDTECRDDVKVFPTPNSLSAWKASFSSADHYVWSDTTLDGEPALRVETNEFGLRYVGVIKNNRLYVIGGNSLIDKGLLSTFTFTD